MVNVEVTVLGYIESAKQNVLPLFHSLSATPLPGWRLQKTDSSERHPAIYRVEMEKYEKW